MDSSSLSPIYLLPQDTLLMIFSKLPLRQLILCRSLSKSFLSLLSSPSFLLLFSSLHPPLPLLALRPPHHHSSPPPPPPLLHAFDPSSHLWLHFPLSFLPFSSLSPVTSSRGQIYLWGDSSPSHSPPLRSLLVCNPLTRSYRVLPHLGSAWSRHGSVLSGSGNRVLVLTELATLSWSNSNNNNRWLKYSSNLPSKPRSPILVGTSLYALCDVGSPWRNLWKLFSCVLPDSEEGTNTAPATRTTSLGWSRVERSEWGDVFDILKRPRLVEGVESKILMVGGLKSSFSLNASCSTILILRLDLESLEWDEAGRMPLDMYKCFQESSKFKVFGGGDKVCFSAKRVGKLALWDNGGGCGGEWRWIEGAPGFGDGLLRGFLFDACLGVVP